MTCFGMQWGSTPNRKQDTSRFCIASIRCMSKRCLRGLEVASVELCEANAVLDGGCRCPGLGGLFVLFQGLVELFLNEELVTRDGH